MSRATSIAGVRPQGWLARVCAPTAQFLGVRVPSAVVWRMARALRHWAWEGDDLARQRSGTRPRVVQTDTFARAEESQMLARAACAPMTVPVRFLITGTSEGSLNCRRKMHGQKIVSGEVLYSSVLESS